MKFDKHPSRLRDTERNKFTVSGIRGTIIPYSPDFNRIIRKYYELLHISKILKLRLSG